MVFTCLNDGNIVYSRRGRGAGDLKFRARGRLSYLTFRYDYVNYMFVVFISSIDGQTYVSRNANANPYRIETYK